MKKLLATGCAILMPIMAMAGVEGVWQTEPNEDGISGHVQISTCGDSYCGVMIGNTAGTDRFKGQTIIANMKAVDDTHFEGGTITDPVENRSYKSKMTLNGNSLKVEGCFLTFCRAQNWVRVQ